MTDRHKLEMLVKDMRGKPFDAQVKLLSAAVTLGRIGVEVPEFLQNLPVDSYGYLTAYGVKAALEGDMEAFVRDWFEAAEKELEDSE